MPNILKLKHTKRFISGSIAGLFLLLQMPLFLLATPSVSAENKPGHTTGGTSDQTNNENFYENTQTGECVKYENLSSEEYISPKEFKVPIDPLKDYTIAVVKAGSDNGEGQDENFEENTFYEDGSFTGGSILTHESGKDISHVILCSKPVTSTVTGSINIVKTAPAATNEQFGFTSTVTGVGNNAFTLGNGQNKLMSNLALNQQFTVTENTFDGFTLTNLVCTTGGTGNTSTRTATITLTATNKDVTCTFTNTKSAVLGDQTGSLTIVKSAPTATNEQFGFTSTNTGVANSTFVLRKNESKLITPLTLGQTYTVTEGTFPGFTLTNLVCTAGGTGSTTTRTATVMLTATNKDVTCTFTNVKNVVEQTGTITIVKQANPETGEAFSFSGNINPTPFDLSDDGNNATAGEFQTFTGLELNRVFTVTESAFPGWTLENIVCTEGGTKQINNRTALITLSAATPEVTCTFTNVKDAVVTPATGSVTINKAVNPGVTEMFDFTSDMPGSFNFQLKGDNSALSTKTTSNLTLGKTYTVKEEAKAGWMLQSISCNNATATPNVTTGTVTITLTNANKEVSCTYTNARQTGGIGGDGEIIRNNGQVLGASTVVKTSPVLSLFTPQVLGASTTSPNNNKQLVNTGSTLFLNIFAGLFVIGIVGALTATQRRQYS